MNGKYFFMSKHIFLTPGQKFGRLTVLNADPIRKGVRGTFYYLCECSCEDHTKKYISVESLKSGHTMSCGCYNKEKIRERAMKVWPPHGTMFGRLKIKEIFLLNEKAHCKCQCNCGNEIVVLLKLLKNT